MMCGRCGCCRCEQDELSLVLWLYSDSAPALFVRLEDIAGIATHFAKPDGCCFSISTQVYARASPRTSGAVASAPPPRVVGFVLRFDLLDAVRIKQMLHAFV